MARMYSRKKGKSGSKKPIQKIASWVTYKPEELEEIIVKLANKGLQSSQIGLVMRDQYGVPTVKIKQLKIAKIMKKHNLYPEFPEDMMNLMKKAVNLHKHMDKNKKDSTSKRGLELTESKIRRLAKYYKAKGIIPKDWKYDINKVKLIVR